MSVRRTILVVALVAAIAAGLLGWSQYRRVRADYDAYQARIQPGVRVAGVDVGWKTPQEAQEKVRAQAAAPYYHDFTLHYQEQIITLSPEASLDFEIPVDEMVAEAVAASHQYDYWEGFRAWVQGEVFELDLNVPLRMSFDPEAATAFSQDLSEQ